MLRTPPLLQTLPAGSPAELVGIFFIERLFTNVAQALSDVKQLPIINESQNVEVLLLLPPKIPE
jgi:hypothetical protein